MAGPTWPQVVADIRDVVARVAAAARLLHQPGGQFQAQEEASRLIAALSLVSLAMIFLVLYSRYRSAVLALIIMGNMPLALIGSVAALWIVGAAAVGRQRWSASSP